MSGGCLRVHRKARLMVETVAFRQTEEAAPTREEQL